MKKYHLFTLIVLALTFSCNRPSPDSNNVSEAADDKEMVSGQLKTNEEKIEARKQKRADRRQERQKEKGDVISPENKTVEDIIAKFSSMVELTEDQKNEMKDIVANSAINNLSLRPENKEERRELKKAKKELHRKFLSILTEEQLKKVKEAITLKDEERSAIETEKDKAARAEKRQKDNR